jgi:hypothetical protein
MDLDQLLYPGKKEIAMNEKERMESYIAMCHCCVIAQVMKDCRMCQFNIGLAEEVKPVDFIAVEIPAQIAKFAMSEKS